MTGGGRGREGRSHARQGRLRGAKTGSSSNGGGPVFQSVPSPAMCIQGSPGGGGDQIWWLNRRGRSRQEPEPAATAKTAGKGATTAFAPAETEPRPPSTGRSSLPPTARVELPPRAVAPVEQVALKRKATSPLLPKHPSPASPTRWECAESRLKGRFRRYITPPWTTLPTCPASFPLRQGSSSQRK